ncbi:hypothetical protein Tco_1156950 [Tanacetum coccineum]
MDDLNITMEEYIMLEEEKAQKRGKVFNWETAKYGKIWYDEYIHDLRSVETEFPSIAFNDELSSKTLSREPTVSSLNDEIDFRVSFDDFDDEDYTPTVSYLDDFDFFKEFKNEFLAIVYNDAQTSKSDLLTELILSPQHIDEFNLNNETSVSEYGEEEQNILYFNDLFPFNIIHPDDLKSEKDNDNNEIDIIQSSEDMAPLPPREQRHPFLRYRGLEYTDADIADFEERLERIYSREIHQLGGARRRLSWRQFILALGLHTEEEMESLGFARYWSESERMILGKGDLHDYWRSISTDGDFLGPPPSYTLIRDPMLRLCHRMMAHNIAGRSQALEKVTVTNLFYFRGLDVGPVNIPYLLARYLRRFAAGRKNGAHISGGQCICKQLDDSWAWVAMGPERQPDAAAGAVGVEEDVHEIRRALAEQREDIHTKTQNGEGKDDFKCGEAEEKFNLNTSL